MKLNSEPVKIWFGYTRRERRSASILLVLIIFIIGSRYVLPEQNIEIENYGTFLADTEITNEISDTDIPSVKMLFAFNPNSASFDTLIKLGFDEREAKTLISYRRGGGKFRKPSDIGKVYGIDSTMAENLEPYIVLPATYGNTVSDSHVQQKPPMDINGCDSMALVALPGIGPVLSARIIKYRNLLGGFARVEQLKEVYGLPEETYEMIKGRLYADSSGLRKIRVNSAGYRELSEIHYLEKYDISAILKYRELTGRINSIEDLKENKILTPEKAEKVKPYLDFR